MNTSSNTGGLVLAGHPHPRALDHVRRFCGLDWSGGASETWAFRYYDLVETDPNRMDPVDVLAAAALHPGLSRDDLAWFEDHRASLDGWLADVAPQAQLGDPDTRIALEQLCEFDGVTLTLLAKVLHRKRPHLVPLVDRHVVDRYRPITGQRKPLEAWPGLLDALVVDLEQNTDALFAIRTELWDELGVDVSALRICDIAIWMEARS
jgi:hypothetical protein